MIRMQIHRHRNLLSIFVWLVVAVTTGQSCFAQRNQGDRNNNLIVKPTFEPQFSIEPLTQTLRGRTSDVLQFAFSVRSKARTTTLQVVPVVLQQDPNGLITHSVEQSDSSIIELLSPSQLVVDDSRSAAIEGIVRLPSQLSSRLILLGLLVRDISDTQNTPETPSGNASASVKFVTQYLLRLNIEIENVRESSSNKLEIPEAEVIAVDGRPYLQISVSNPTSSSFGFHANARLRPLGGTGSRMQIGLPLNCRRAVDGPQRYDASILPLTNVQLGDFLPSAVPAGDYLLEVDLESQGTRIKTTRQRISILPRQFPAQEVLLAELENGVSISPAQIEFSQLRGGKRRVAVNFKNSSKENATVQLQAFEIAPDSEVTLENATLPAKSLILQTQDFVLAPGRSRKVALTMRSTKSASPVTPAALVVTTRLENRNETITKRLPIVFVNNGTGQVAAELSDLRWNPQSNKPSFLVDVASSGTKHLPMIARLLIFRDNQLQWEIQGGFSRWLLPGATSPVEFPVPSEFPPGNYVLRCELQVDGKIERIEQAFEAAALPVSTNLP